MDSEKPPSAGSDLLVEPSEAASEQDIFRAEVDQVLALTQQDVLSKGAFSNNSEANQSWINSRKIVADFQPVPWFIWRLSNYVFGTNSIPDPIPQGMVLGLRRLLFAAASDSILGEGKKVNDIRKALMILPEGVVGAVGVIHATCRKLHSKPNERIWMPVLEDAVLRAHIGYYVGQQDRRFGGGRGMLAGFAGRCGLAILIANGELAQARKCLELLAAGMEIGAVGLQVYECEPLHASAMALSASGCGRSSAYATVKYASPTEFDEVPTEDQFRWLSAFTITENVRTGRADQIDAEHWAALNFDNAEDQMELQEVSKLATRNGHGWNWIL